MAAYSCLLKRTGVYVRTSEDLHVMLLTARMMIKWTQHLVQRRVEEGGTQMCVCGGGGGILV